MWCAEDGKASQEMLWDSETLTRHWNGVAEEVERLVQLFRLFRCYAKLKGKGR